MREIMFDGRTYDIRRFIRVIACKKFSPSFATISDGMCRKMQCNYVNGKSARILVPYILANCYNICTAHCIPLQYEMHSTYTYKTLLK